MIFLAVSVSACGHSQPPQAMIIAASATANEPAPELSADIVQMLQSAGAAYVRAYLRLAAGQLDDAAAEAEAGLETADELGTHTFTPIGILVLATVWLLRGDLSAAAHYIRRYQAHSARGLAFPAGWATASRGVVRVRMSILSATCAVEIHTLRPEMT